VKLNDEYDGFEVDETYIYDLLGIKEVTKYVPMNYKREQLMDFFINKDRTPFAKVTNKLQRALSIADKRQTEHYQKELVGTAIRNTLGKYPEATLITKEMQNKFLNELINEIMPFIVHQGNKVRATLKKNS
jgi:hypothetical protein